MEQVYLFTFFSLFCYSVAMADIGSTSAYKESNENNRNQSKTSVNSIAPKKVLHFSDGTIEEYDDKPEGNKDNLDGIPKVEHIDTSTMSWPEWVAYKASSAGSSTLGAIDYVGGHLAWFFGITSPKYYYEIEEYKRQKELEEKEAQKAKGWVPEDVDQSDVITVPLQSLGLNRNHSSQNTPPV